MGKVTKKETKSCLEVNEIDFTRKYTAKNKLLPRSQQNRLHHKKVTKRKQKSCLKVNEIDFTIRRTLQKYASRSPKSTSITRAPIKREANQKSKGELEN